MAGLAQDGVHVWGMLEGGGGVEVSVGGMGLDGMV